MKRSRRQFLRSAIPAGVVGLAGCATVNEDTPGGNSNGNGGNGDPAGTASPTGTADPEESGTPTDEPATPHPGGDVWAWFQFDLPNTGKAAWRRGPDTGVSQAWATEIPGGSNLQPTFDEQQVYVAGRGGVHALDRETGQRRWTFDAEETDPAMPAVGDGYVYVVTDNGVFKVNAEAGWTAWEYWFVERINNFTWIESLSAPKIIGDALYVHLVVRRKDVSPAQVSMIVGLDLHDGSRTFRAVSDGSVKSPRGVYAATPAYAGGSFYYTTRVGQKSADLYRVNGGNGRTRWRRRYEGFGATPPTVVGGRVYLADFFAQSYDAGNGSFLWRKELDPVLVTDGLAGTDDLTVYATGGGADPGRLYALAPDSEQVWRHEAGDDFGVPIIGRDTVYAGNTDGTLRALSVDTGERRWSHPVDLPTSASVRFSPPSISDDVLYVTAKTREDGGVVSKAFAFERA